MKYLNFLFGVLFLPMVIIGQNSETKTKSMLDLAYPYQTKFAHLGDSIQLAYVDEGSGDPTLIFIHGLGSYLPAWKKNIDSLKLHFRCIAIDLPGYGKSSKGDHPYNMSFFASVVRQFIDQLELQNVVLVGHSMGGQISITTVLQNTGHISKLVLVAPAGFETFSASESQLLQNFYTPAILKALPETQIRKNFEINFVQFPEDAEFMYQDRLYMRETTEYDRYCNMIPRCVAGMLNEPVFERLPEIKVPALVLYGANDALIPNKFLHTALTTEAVAKSGSEKIPACQMKLIPNAGHFVQWEGATPVNEAIRAFLMP